MSYNTITLEKQGAAAIVTLNRPDRMNAFTGKMMHEMISAIDETDADDNVRAVIFTGAGDRAFCAGADLERGADAFNADARPDKGQQESGIRRDGGGLLTLRLFNSKKPLIGAINGAAVGIGATMTLPMDIRLASTTARFGFVFVRRGIVPEAASSWFLPRLVGVSKALEWVYSGRVFGAQEALDGGLVSKLHEPDQLLDAALSIANEIAENTSAVSITLSRHALWRMLGEPHPMMAHRIESRGIQMLGKSADAAEGVNSFLEKRSPDFSNKVSKDMPDYFPWWEEPEFK